jgi:hypothetical protein
MVTLTLVLYVLLTDEGFRVQPDQVSVVGLRFVSQDEARAQLADLYRRPSSLRIRAGEIVAGLESLPQVVSAQAVVRLPGEVRVEVVEREPLFVWRNGGQAWLIDREGVLIAPREAAGVEELGSGALGSALPEVDDARVLDPPPGLGDRLGAQDLQVMRTLLALDAEVLHSSSGELRLRVDDREGYVIQNVDRALSARFGHYAPTVHPVDAIPREVQCLAAVLAADEPRLQSVTLALSDDGCGTRVVVKREG